MNVCLFLWKFKKSIRVIAIEIRMCIFKIFIETMGNNVDLGLNRRSECVKWLWYIFGRNGLIALHHWENRKELKLLQNFIKKQWNLSI